MFAVHFLHALVEKKKDMEKVVSLLRGVKKCDKMKGKLSFMWLLKSNCGEHHGYDDFPVNFP